MNAEMPNPITSLTEPQNWDQKELTNPRVLLAAFGARRIVNECVPNLPLGHDCQCDAIIISGQSYRYDVVLVELAPLSANVFTPAGEFSTELEHAIQNVENCLAWVDDNTEQFLVTLSKAMKNRYGARQILRKTGPLWQSAKHGRRFTSAKIVIGRAESFPENMDTIQLALSGQTLEITSYRKLQEGMRRVREQERTAFEFRLP